MKTGATRQYLQYVVKLTQSMQLSTTTAKLAGSMSLLSAVREMTPLRATIRWLRSALNVNGARQC